MGELIIGGVGLARYLDPAKDAEKYAPFPTLGWERAYRSGDLVVYDEEGLLFAGRGDDQVKLGGRRIELGEVDNALLALPDVVSAAAAVRPSRAGNQLLVGYVTAEDSFDADGAVEHLRSDMPAALVPRLASWRRCRPAPRARSTGTRCPGRWPPRAGPQSRGAAGHRGLDRRAVARGRGRGGPTPSDDFFDLGGGSLTAAQMVSRLRTRYPEVTVADLYEHPTVGRLAAARQMAAPAAPSRPRGFARPRRRPRSARSSSRFRCGCCPACAG